MGCPYGMFEMCIRDRVKTEVTPEKPVTEEVKTKKVEREAQKVKVKKEDTDDDQFAAIKYSYSYTAQVSFCLLYTSRTHKCS